jgi:hypothetical protein
MFHLISSLSKRKVNNDLSVLINVSFVSISGDAKRSLKTFGNQDIGVLALLDSRTIAGRFHIYHR